MLLFFLNVITFYYFQLDALSNNKTYLKISY